MGVFILKILCWINFYRANSIPRLQHFQVSYESRSSASTEIWGNLWSGGISQSMLCSCFSILHFLSLNRDLVIDLLTTQAYWKVSIFCCRSCICWPSKHFVDIERWNRKAAITVRIAYRKEKIKSTENELFPEQSSLQKWEWFSI